MQHAELIGLHTQALPLVCCSLSILDSGVVMLRVIQAAGLLMMSLGVIALVKPESLVEIFDYLPELTQYTSRAGFDMQATVQNSAVFMAVLGGVVGGVGVLGCAGACLSIQCMLSAVSCPCAFYRFKNHCTFNMSLWLLHLTSLQIILCTVGPNCTAVYRPPATQLTALFSRTFRVSFKHIS